MKPNNPLHIQNKFMNLFVRFRDDAGVQLTLEYAEADAMTMVLNEAHVIELAGALVAHLAHHAPSPLELGTVLHKSIGEAK